MSSMKPLLCIRNDRDDTLGITCSTLATAGVPLMRLDAFDASVQWPALEEISGLIIFGGEMNVDEVDVHPQLLTQRDLMRRAVDAGLPVLGICLGAQMLARAFGARVFRAPVRELGFKPVRVSDEGERDLLLGAFSTGDLVFQWHEDTFDLPDGADLLVAVDDVPNQAFRLGRTAWGGNGRRTRSATSCECTSTRGSSGRGRCLRLSPARCAPRPFRGISWR